MPPSWPEKRLVSGGSTLLDFQAKNFPLPVDKNFEHRYLCPVTSLEWAEVWRG
jgi:hypothetical protein